MAGIKGQLSRWGLPPARLGPVAPWLRRPVGLAWSILFLFTMFAQGMGLWQVYIDVTRTQPMLTSIGLSDLGDRDGSYDIFFDPETEAVKKQGFPEDARILAVNGHPLARSAVAQDLLPYVGAGPVKLVVEDKAGRIQTFTLQREKPQAVRSLSSMNMTMIGHVTFSLLVLVFLFTAGMLFRRQPFDPVSLLLSTAFLCGAASLGPAVYFYIWIRSYWLVDVFMGLWSVLTVTALPAFPDGRFIPRWSGWFAVAAPVMFALLLTTETEDIMVPIFIAYLGLGIWLPIRRYRKADPGLEKQQLKWVAFGFASAGTLIMIGLLVIYAVVSLQLSEDTKQIAGLIGIISLVLSLILLPLGVLISLLRYRLWDADAAIGRSLGYAAMTLVVGGLWAAFMTMFNEILAGTFGTNKPTIAAISAVIAGLLLAPARDRVNGWVERRFLAGVVALRKMPERLQLWQHDDHPRDLGERIVGAIADGLHASSVAILIYLDEGYRTVGEVRADQTTVDRWMKEHANTGALHVDNIDRKDPQFPVRITLDDDGAPIGVLLLGPRSDGSIYSRDERKALEAIENPLAAALRQAQLRRRRDINTRDLIEMLETRIAALETQGTGASADRTSNDRQQS